MLINYPAAPLYKEPYASELDDEAWYGQQADILEDMGEFCRVRMIYGYQSCVRRRHLMEWQYENEPMTVSLPFGAVHEAGDIKSRSLMLLPRGAQVEPIGEREGWTEIRLIGGERGFMKTIGLKPERTAVIEEEALRKSIVDSAMRYLGVPYRWGGRTPLGVDCSGLCHSAYLLNGVAIYRNASIQPGYPVHSISFACAKEADLLYFPGHMALYLGDGRYIHATARENRVCINSLDEGSPLYREDIANSLICAGSVF